MWRQRRASLTSSDGSTSTVPPALPHIEVATDRLPRMSDPFGFTIDSGNDRPSLHGDFCAAVRADPQSAEPLTLTQRSNGNAVISSPHAACTDGAGDQFVAAFASGPVVACPWYSPAVALRDRAIADPATAPGIAISSTGLGTGCATGRISATTNVGGCTGLFLP